MKSRLALAALCALAAYNALYFFPVTVDDAFISLRYAWNLVHGAGLVFNPGERVEGYSNPSWTLYGAALLAAGAEPLEALKWSGVALVTALPAVTWWTGRRLGLSEWWALLPAALCAVDLNVAFWAPNGLETPLWTVLIAAWPGLCARRWAGGERFPVSALVGALLYVTRPEAPLFIAPVVLVELWRARSDPRAAVVWLATLAVPCLAWLGFRKVYYGDWVANTYFVKASHGWRLDIFKKYLASWLGVNAPVTGALLCLAAPLAILSPGGRIAAVALAVQFVFVMRAGGDWMAQNRFWSPAVPLAGLVVAAGASQLAGRLAGRANAARFVALAVILPLLPQAWRHLTLEYLYLDGDHTNIVERWGGNAKSTLDRVNGPFWTGVPERVVRVLDHVPDGKVIAHSEIGLLAYVTDNPIVDAFGLVDRRLSGATGENLADVIESLPPPDYLLMRDNVPMLSMMTKTSWYAKTGYAERQRWSNVWIEAPGPVDELPPEPAFMRLDRAVERVPREMAFHLARIELARKTRDKAREARYCDALAEEIPALGGYCKASKGAQKPEDIPFVPFLTQTTNGGFDDGTTGWGPVPGDATGFAAEDGALKVTGSMWVCSDWQPVKGDLRIAGKVRADAITGAKNERQGAAVGFRVHKADKTDTYPIVKAWSGTTEWTPFQLTWPSDDDYVEYRACVGLNNAQGAAWFDDVTAGTEDAPVAEGG